MAQKKKFYTNPTTGASAALYKQQTKAVERDNSAALSAMSGIASQAFDSITTVRCFDQSSDLVYIDG